MTHSFDNVPDRRNTHSYKWDQSAKLFGDPNILPLWVADMDFPSPPAVTEALVRRAEQGVYGYTFRSDDYTAAPPAGCSTATAGRSQLHRPLTSLALSPH